MLRIDQHLVDEMIAHARADHPDEACGVITGPEGSDEPRRFIKMVTVSYTHLTLPTNREV